MDEQDRHLRWYYWNVLDCHERSLESLVRFLTVVVLLVQSNIAPPACCDYY